MDMKEEMMSDAVDDAMEDEDEGEGEEVESDKILKEVLDEIGMSMNESVSANSAAENPTSSSRAFPHRHCILTLPARLGAHSQPARQRAPPVLPRRRGRGRTQHAPSSRLGWWWWWRRQQGGRRSPAPTRHVATRLEQ